MSRNRRRRKAASRPVTGPTFNVTVAMQSDGSIHVDPHFNEAAIDQFDQRYSGVREDYDPRWEPLQKVAYALYDICEEIFYGYLEQEELPVPEDIAKEVPDLKVNSVVDVVDIAGMSPAR